MMPIEKLKGAGQRRLKHGGYSLLAPRLAVQYPALQHYLRETRKGLIEHLGGEDRVTEPQMILVNNLISRLTVTRLVEIFISRTSPFVVSDLRKSPPILTLQPALTHSYLAFSNSIDRGLALLGLERPKHVRDPLVLDIIRINEAEADQPDCQDDESQPKEEE